MGKEKPKKEEILQVKELLKHDDFSFVRQGLIFLETFQQSLDLKEWLELLKILTAQRKMRQKHLLNLRVLREHFSAFIYTEDLALWIFATSAVYFPAKVYQEKYTQIQLSSVGLQHIPEAIGNFHGLQYLDFSGNDIRELPDIICSLSNVESLCMDNNQLEQLPQNIGNLENLGYLYLSWNNLHEIPASIGRLSNLVSLILDGNNLMKIPEEIGALRSLRKLDIAGNNISKLPSSIAQLSQLRQLSITANGITREHYKQLKLMLPNCRIIY